MIEESEKDKRRRLKKEIKDIVNRMLRIKAEEAVEKGLDDVAQEEAEKIVDKKFPGLKEVFEKAGEAAPLQLIDDIFENEAEDFIDV